MFSNRRLAAALMLAYLAAVAFIVFLPTGEIASGSVRRLHAALGLLGVQDLVTPGHVEFVTNVLLFVPLSVLGATFRPAWHSAQWLAVGLVGTTVIEVSQLLFLPGRSTQLVDVVANTSGALLGFLLVDWRRSSSGASVQTDHSHG